MNRSRRTCLGNDEVDFDIVSTASIGLCNHSHIISLIPLYFETPWRGLYLRCIITIILSELLLNFNLCTMAVLVPMLLLLCIYRDSCTRGDSERGDQATVTAGVFFGVHFFMMFLF